MPQRALDPGTDSVTVSIRVPKSVKTDYKRRAKSSGRSLSEWIRLTLDSGVTLPKGSVTQTAPPPNKHVHEVEASVHTGAGVEVSRCKCGAIFVNNRWV